MTYIDKEELAKGRKQQMSLIRVKNKRKWQMGHVDQEEVAKERKQQMNHV